MKKQIKINRLQLILIVISIIVVESIIVYYFSNSINQNIEIAYKVITNQADKIFHATKKHSPASTNKKSNILATTTPMR